MVYEKLFVRSAEEMNPVEHNAFGDVPLSLGMYRERGYLRNEFPDEKSRANFDNYLMQIVRSTKVFIPDIAIGWEDIDDKTGGPMTPDTERAITVTTICDTTLKSFMKQYDKYRHFIRLPLSSVFIENHSTGMLLEQDGATRIRLRAIMNLSGTIASFGTVTFNPCDAVKIINGTVIPWNFQINIDAYGRQGEQTYSVIEGNTDIPNDFRWIVWESLAYIIAVSETILFLNVKNILIHEYRATNRELTQKVPSSLRPLFVYRIVDLFREKTKIASLREAIDYANPEAKVTVERRASLVRGHYKEIRGRLYWWNFFIRNKANLKSAGFVSKDYSILH